MDRLGKCLLCRCELIENLPARDLPMCHSSTWSNLMRAFTSYMAPFEKSATDFSSRLHLFCTVCLNLVSILYDLHEKIETHRNHIEFVLRMSNIKKHCNDFVAAQPSDTVTNQNSVVVVDLMDANQSSDSENEGLCSDTRVEEEEDSSASAAGEMTGSGEISTKLAGRHRNIRMIEKSPNCWYYDEFAATKAGDKYRCVTCNAAYKHMNNMRAHLRENHYRKSSPALNNTSSETFNPNGSHVMSKRRAPLSTGFVCYFCGKLFKSAFKLRQHSLNHSSERPFQCSVCSKAFKTVAVLAKHRLSHIPENEWEFVCGHCGRRFATDARLQNHLSSHTKDKRFQCEDCGRKYSTPEALYTHRNTHTGAKKYACDICDMEFTQSGSVLRHKRTAHGFPKKRNIGGNDGNASSKQQPDTTTT